MWIAIAHQEIENRRKGKLCHLISSILIFAFSFFFFFYFSILLDNCMDDECDKYKGHFHTVFLPAGNIQSIHYQIESLLVFIIIISWKHLINIYLRRKWRDEKKVNNFSWFWRKLFVVNHSIPLFWHQKIHVIKYARSHCIWTTFEA